MTPDAAERIRAAVGELADALIAAAEKPHQAERLLSVDEAARIAGVGRTLLYRQIGTGKVRSIQVGRRRLVPESAIADLVAG